MKFVFALAATLLMLSLAAAQPAVGTNYNLRNYYYDSNGWLQPGSLGTFYPDLSISCTSSYSKYPCFYSHGYTYDGFYHLTLARPPLPYPYISSPRDLGFKPHSYASPSGSFARTYYTTPVAAHINSGRSTNFPPSIAFASENAALQGNYPQQQYYLQPSQLQPTERIQASQFTYAYGGARWLEGPNYWYDARFDQGKEPHTSSTFPPDFFTGFYYSNSNQQGYYDQYQVKEPARKKTILVTTVSNSSA